MSAPARKTGLAEIFHAVSGCEFAKSIQKARETSPLIRINADLKPGYENYDCWLEGSGLTGAAVSLDTYELSGVFSLNSRGKDLMHFLTDQYSFLHLNCYAGFLVDFYKRFGFEVTGRDTNWHEKGGPDVVLMQFHKDEHRPGR